MRARLAAFAGAATLAGSSLLLATPAHAADTAEDFYPGKYGNWSFQAPIVALNGSGVTGTIYAQGYDYSATVRAEISGLAPDGAHPMGIYVGGSGQCPAPGTTISATEIATQLGQPTVALTVDGDASADSLLTLDRAPQANGGSFSYSRDATVDQGTLNGFLAGTAMVVIHGVDSNGNGSYDATPASDLAPAVGKEITDPAACAKLVPSQMNAIPEGGAATGGGSTAGVENKGMIGAGAAALTGAAVLVGMSRRRQHA